VANRRLYNSFGEVTALHGGCEIGAEEFGIVSLLPVLEK